MARVVLASEFDAFLNGLPNVPPGCFVDTNLLFATDYEAHRLFEEAVELGEMIGARKIPIYSNATIRTELLELKRRVLIGEALLDFLDLGQRHHPVTVTNMLRSLRTSVQKAETDESHFLLPDRRIKDFRDLFEREIAPGAWKDFCETFVGDKLKSEWVSQVERKGINYLDGKPSEYLREPVTWEDAIGLIETYGIGTSDALIINIFLKSVFPFIVTADSDVAYCMANIDTDKIVVVPNSLDFPSVKA